MSPKVKKLPCIRRAMWLITICLILCTAVSLFAALSAETLTVPLEATPNSVTASEEGIAEWSIGERCLTLRALRKGHVFLQPDNGPALQLYTYSSGFIYEWETDCFSGWRTVRIATIAFLIATSAILVIETLRQLRRELYSYASPLLIGLSILMVLATVINLCRANAPTMNASIELLVHTASFILLGTLPITLLVGIAMLISNISLLRHEGNRPRNLLGSAVLLGQSLLVTVLLCFTDYNGAEAGRGVPIPLLCFLSGMLVISTCKLIGIVLCGLKAAGNEPEPDKDCILILGCMLSRNGGLTPLLRGRVDRALAFKRSQQETTGRNAVLIPCGGKGDNELTSEAAAMRTYLLAQGVPEAEILCEDRSRNTWENMRNAKALMPEGARIAFSTTNYHVFRAGLWAHRNGVDADGMGSGTKWYYWPNAFIREYIAMFVANLPHELLTLLTTAVIAMLLPIILL